MAEITLTSRSAFHGILPPFVSDGGVRIADRDGAGMATVVVRRGCRQLLRAALLLTHRVGLRDGPTVSFGDTMFLVGTGVDAWLAVTTAEIPAFSAELAIALVDIAAVCDQSDGYGLLRVSGTRAVDMLRRLLQIDLHLSVFPAGSAASTIAAHIPLLVWRLDEGTFELAVYRSYAASFMHALKEAAEPFGLSHVPLARG